uniref:ORF11 n=1 Tax=Nitrosopumilaceae spindle-shaped virus TaxID=3065433 RepID=A0AAT9J7K3_9VIRU
MTQPSSSNRKIAFVGTSVNMTDNEERDVRQFIGLILNSRYTGNEIIISGGAKGVDTIALDVAKSLGFETLVYKPDYETWQSYKKRNLQIANDCDELHCISVPVHKTKCYHHEDPEERNHEKTAGCWTMNKVLELGKSAQLMVTFSR